MIRTETARKICNSWHGGQWSAFYQFASSGVYMIENHLQYLKEVEECINPSNDHRTLTKGELRGLTSLRAYFMTCNTKALSKNWEAINK